eukprot:jgi/Psemu1/56520/gm1.56520_g
MQPTHNKIRDSFLALINGCTPIFTKDNVLKVLADLRKCKITSFDIVFAINDKLSSKGLWRNHAEHNIFNPNPLTDPDSLSVDYLVIHTVTALQTNLNTSQSAIPHDILQMYISTFGITDITPAKQSLRNFTSRKLH